MKKITFFLLFGLLSFFSNAQIGLSENFDGGLAPPAGWGFTGYFGTVVSVCDGFSMRDQLSDASTTGNLTAPNLIGQSNGTDITVSFDYKIVDWSAAVDATPPGWGELLVQYSTNDGIDWTTAFTVDDNNHITSNECANFEFIIAGTDVPSSSDFKLQFVGNWASGNYYIYLDNVQATQQVEGPAGCSTMTTPVDGSTGVSINTDLEWTAANNLPQGYGLTVGTTSGGTDIADTDTGLSTVYDLPVLEYSTTYYVNITPYNQNGPAVDCSEFTFTTGADPNAPVDCETGTPINVQYCYTDGDTTTWNFSSSNGNPLNVFFNAGYMESCCDDILVYNASDDTDPGTLIYSGNNGGDLTGLSLVADSGFLYIVIDSDTSVNCQSTANAPMDFDVSCVDPLAVPNCNAALTTPENGATNVDVATNLVWSPASIIITGYNLSIGTTSGGVDVLDNEDVGDVLNYTFGSLLQYETTYYVTITPYNDNGPATECAEYVFTTEVNPYQCEAEDQCLFTFVLTDSFGDGWNGNTMTLFQDGNEIETFGADFTTGNGPLEIQIPLCTGLPYELFWNDGGSFAGEVGVAIIDPFDEEVFNMSSGNGGLQGTSLYTDVANCIPPTCPKPTDIVIGIINQNDVEISWTDNTAGSNNPATQWQVIVQPLGSGYPDGTEPEIVVTSDNPYVYTGLDSGTQYEVYVSAVCIEGEDISDWQGPVAFDTTICDAVDQCNYVFTLTDSFGDGWNGNTMSVLQNGIEVAIFGDEFTTGTGPIEVEVALCDGVPFELYWNDGGAFAGEVGVSITDPFADELFTMSSGNGGLQDSSLYTGVVNCTPPTCPRPTDITIGQININDVEISWTDNTAASENPATQWQVIVQPLGSGYPDGTEPEIVVTSDNPYVYTGLDSGTQYEVYVSAVCIEGEDISDWSGPVPFDTPVLIDCEIGSTNFTYCYDDDEIYEVVYTNTGGFPLNIEFNAGSLGFGDDLIILDSDGTTVLYNQDNVDDLEGLLITSTGNTLTVLLDTSGFGSCVSGAEDQLDYDIWCQTCIPQAVSFDVVNGDCDTDPNNPVFEVEVDITDMGGAESITITDNQGSNEVVVTEIGAIILGPYPANANVIVTAVNADDPNCTSESNPLTFLCPPPPNPCSIVFAGDDQEVDCDNPETELSGYYHLYGNDTTTYEINATETCPAPPVDGATPTSVNTDDVWSGVIDLGFDFCFYGGVYDQVIVGSNGIISFEIENANTGNGWAYDPEDTLPNNDNPSITEGNIFGVGHDINPATCGSIDYVVLGSAPYRQFIVNFNNVCHFSCTDIQSTSQIVLFESSNNIEIHVLEKPTCPGWNDGGLAVIGLQSVDDTQATTPPGRNMGIWEVTPDAPESWRFSPGGEPLFSIEWLDEDGTVVGTEQNVTVTPTETTTYTLAVTYDLCTGGQATVEDSVIVNFGGGTSDTSFELTPTCDGATALITGDEGGTFSFNPEVADGAEIDSDTGTVTNASPGITYGVEYSVEGDCPSITILEFTVLPADDASFTLESTCNEATATIIGDEGGTFAFNPEPGDGAVLNADGSISNGVLGNTYTVEYTTNGECPASSTQTIMLEDTVAPIAIAQDVTIELDASGNASISVEDIDNGSSDDCGIASITIDIENFTCENIGENTVTLTVTDGGGNISTAEATVTVIGYPVEVTITEAPLSDYCQGVILTANSEDAAAYEWSTDEGTQSIEVTENGVYSVTVTSSSGCTGYAEYEVTSVQDGTSISDYTIVANDRVYLHGGNVVESGAVGVTSSGGQIRLHQDSHIQGTGEADDFALNQGSTIGNQVTATANPFIPEFVYNTMSNSGSPSVEVGAGETMTLDEEVYDLVRVRSGATAIFTQSNVFINRIQTWEGANIESESCLNLYLNDLFILANQGTINSAGNRVAFYVNNDIHIEKGSNVQAIMYANDSQILAKGNNLNSNNPESTYMTGLFIANRVHGDQNVIWNTADICEPCPTYSDENMNRGLFEVVSWPNPSNTKFNLKVRTEDFISQANVLVYDISGKLVHTAKLDPSGEINFGSELEGGIYLVKVKQGKNTKIVRLVKY